MSTESLRTPRVQEQSQPQASQLEEQPAAATQAASAPASQTESLPAPNLEALQAELRELKDRYPRLAADFDNFKRRTAQETEIRAAARKEVFILEMLPVLDSLDRALACDGSASREHLHQGVEMISLQLLQLLHRHDIKPDDCLGRQFDPHRHEAVGTGHDSGQPAHVVLKVSRRGRMRGGEVLRPAHVVVNDLTQAQPNDTIHSRPPKHDQQLKAQEVVVTLVPPGSTR